MWRTLPRPWLSSPPMSSPALLKGMAHPKTCKIVHLGIRLSALSTVYKVTEGTTKAPYANGGKASEEKGVAPGRGDPLRLTVFVCFRGGACAAAPPPGHPPSPKQPPRHGGRRRAMHAQGGDHQRQRRRSIGLNRLSAGLGSDVIRHRGYGHGAAHRGVAGPYENMGVQQGPGADRFTVRRGTRGATIASSSLVAAGASSPSPGSPSRRHCPGRAATAAASSTAGGTLTITSSIISGNFAFNGGKVYSNTELTGSKTTITNSTTSGNSATDRGGGAFNFDGPSVLEHSTMTKSTAPKRPASCGRAPGHPNPHRGALLPLSPTTPTPTWTWSFCWHQPLRSNGYNLIGDGNTSLPSTRAGRSKRERSQARSPRRQRRANETATPCAKSARPGQGQSLRDDHQPARRDPTNRPRQRL